MKRGQKPMGKVKIKWNTGFAYAIGLLVADGCLYKDGRHISLTTKDLEQAKNFKKCLNINVKVGLKARGYSKEKKYFHIQFGDVLFYGFLKKIGLSPAKSKTISKVLIPKKYFFDYLRGYFDGDGCSYSFYDSVWKKSYRFYISFACGSTKHIEWLKKTLNDYIKVKGHISHNSNHPSSFQLRYSKQEALLIVKKMYYKKGLVCLKRKHLKINKSLNVINKYVEVV